MSSILNKAAFKEYVLSLSKEHRLGKFTRVGASFFERLEAKLKNLTVDEVKRHPSKGVTLQ